jgi:hypothetical protein
MTYLCRKERCSALLAENLGWPSAHLKVENQIAPRPSPSIASAVGRLSQSSTRGRVSVRCALLTSAGDN